MDFFILLLVLICEGSIKGTLNIEGLSAVFGGTQNFLKPGNFIVDVMPETRVAKEVSTFADFLPILLRVLHGADFTDECVCLYFPKFLKYCSGDLGIGHTSSWLPAAGKSNYGLEDGLGNFQVLRPVGCHGHVRFVGSRSGGLAHSDVLHINLLDAPAGHIGILLQQVVIGVVFIVLSNYFRAGHPIIISLSKQILWDGLIAPGIWFLPPSSSNSKLLVRFIIANAFIFITIYNRN